MRVPLMNGLGSLELINDAEDDWEYAPVCDSPDRVARMAIADDRSPGAARVRALLANAMLGATPSQKPGTSLIRALEAALRDGTVRLTGWRGATPERLAPYTPPPKPATATQAPPRVAKSAPPSAPPPEEATEASAECMKEAAEDGAPLVEQAEA